MVHAVQNTQIQRDNQKGNKDIKAHYTIHHEANLYFSFIIPHYTIQLWQRPMVCHVIKAKTMHQLPQISLTQTGSGAHTAVNHEWALPGL